jgi:hypothetical protein
MCWWLPVFSGLPIGPQVSGSQCVDEHFKILNTQKILERRVNRRQIQQLMPAKNPPLQHFSSFFSNFLFFILIKIFRRCIIHNLKFICLRGANRCSVRIGNKKLKYFH